MSIEKKQREIKLKRGQLYWLILEVIGLSLVSGGGTPLRPTLPIMLSSIKEIIQELKKIKVEQEKLKKSLEKLEKREIVDLIEKGDKVYVYVRDYKNIHLIKYSIKSLLDFKRKEKKWDGRWFLVFFDVPEIQRNKRNFLRRFLKYLGFYPYQKSVYLFPYECEKEVNLIKKMVEGGKYLSYIIAEKIDREDEAKKFFKLRED